MARVKAACGLPVVVGFGVKTPEKAAQVARVADGVVVGSALVEEIAGALAANENVTRAVLSKAAALAKAVRSAREGNA
ncbi:Tryptophan synthase alpha chain [compost metagenome]